MSFAKLFAVVSLAGFAAAQGGTPAPGSREAMWPAPTKEDWAKPCLIRWQRSYEDALAVSRDTGKAILVCVNMDGEIASEHYAGIRYRQPEIAPFYAPYVSVIASVYRHTPRDYDEHGKRIPCPRFGTVTCGEHIALEPIVYDMFLDETRVAPRHIMVELDGKETYDVFYALDTDSVFQTLHKGIVDRPNPAPPRLEDDRTIVERVNSRDSEDRELVESAWIRGDLLVKKTLLRAAVTQKDLSSNDLLRLALFGADGELAGVAWEALLSSDSPAAVNLLAQALRFPLEPAERTRLIETLERIGESSPRAKRLAKVQRGLLQRGAGDIAASELPISSDRLNRERLEARATRAGEDPTDPNFRMALAEELVAVALADASSKYRKLYFEDARSAALLAAEQGADAWRVDAVMALVAQEAGEWREAASRSVSAVEGMPAGTYSAHHVDLLAIYVRVRYRDIARAVNRELDWPAEWLTKLDAAYSMLVVHPDGTAVQVLDHYTLLNALEAKLDAAAVLDRGLLRFPDSWELHAQLRERLLSDRSLDGLQGLEAHYDSLLAQEQAAPYLNWYAGYASIVAAEYHRRAGKDPQAVSAYDRAIAHYERGISLANDTRATADHYIALAIAGRARLALERGDLELALKEIKASFERAPMSAASLDGLNLSPVATAQMLRAMLREAGHVELVDALQASLDALDPSMLEPAEFDRQPR